MIVPPEMHRNIFRGKNLGTAVTDEQWAAIEDGTFTDLYIGDYWVMGGKNWRIADIDYWWNTGDIAFTKHHLVIMPDRSLYQAQMNNTDTTDGGYVGSAMYTTNLEQAKTTIKSLFGETHVLPHREYLINTVKDGVQKDGAWYEVDVAIPNEIMMTGHSQYAVKNDGQNLPVLIEVNNTQLSLFKLNRQFTFIRENTWWLRDVTSSSTFSRYATTSPILSSLASEEHGVRPVFPIGT